MTDQRSVSRKGNRRLAMAFAGVLALAAFAALADPRHQGHGGGGFPPPRGGFSAPHGGFPGPHGGFPPPRMAGAPWGGPPPSRPMGGQPFDPRRHNGYWLGQRWYYGPPPDPTLRAPNFRPGFAPFRPGGFLPPQYQAFAVDDWARFHLRRPPYGYRWVQAGDEFLLVSISTNQIFDVVSDF